MSKQAQQQAQRLIEEVERQLQPLATRQALAYWKLATSATDAARAEYVEARGRLRRFLSRKDPFDEIVALRGEVDRREDELTKRQLDLLYGLYLPHQITGELIARQNELEEAIERIHAEQRPTEAGSIKGPIGLDTFPVSEQVAALGQDLREASETIAHEAAPLLLQLVEARNEGARLAGYTDYYSMSLAAHETGEEALLSLLGALEDALPEPGYEARRDNAFDSCLDSLFCGRDLAALATEYFDGIGLRVGKALSQSDLSDRPGKAAGAFCLDVDAAGDVRILLSLRPTERGSRTLFHQLGRAIYHLNIAKEFPYLLRRPAHPAAVVGVGLLFERLIYDEHWLEAWSGASAAEALEVALAARAAAEPARVASIRDRLLTVHFERALYREPSERLDEVWRDLVQRFFGEEGDRSPGWATRLDFSTAPVTQQDWLLGEVVAAELGDMVEDELGEGALALSPAAGYLLIDRWFAHGARFPLNELATMAFGRPLERGESIARRFRN